MSTAAPTSHAPPSSAPSAADIDASLPTRERLVLAALHLFWAQGYAATSLAHILQEAGANPGSLHHFFPTKDALLSAVLDQLEQVHTHILNQCYPGSSPEGGGMFVRSTNAEGAAGRDDSPHPRTSKDEECSSGPRSDERGGGSGQNANPPLPTHPESAPPSWLRGSVAPSLPPPNPLAIFLFYRDFLRRGDCALGCPILNLACELSDSHPAVRERLDRLLSMTRARIASTLLDHPYPELLALLITTALHGALIHSRAAKSTAPIEAAYTQLQAFVILPLSPSGGDVAVLRDREGCL